MTVQDMFVRWHARAAIGGQRYPWIRYGTCIGFGHRKSGHASQRFGGANCAM
ncbi:hypothetical protein [Bifidobacterium subtile]|uniref:hypothetical protein n=1 Tax=Bifidobacterium subtile TaxID=77635 RepID=UPI002F35F45F